MSTSVNRALIQLFSDRNCGDQAQFDFFVKSDYVERLFKDCASGISSEASTFLQELIFDSEISDPCDPSKSHNDIIEQLKSDVCLTNSGIVELDDIKNGLYQQDHIILTNSFKACPKLMCVYNRLKEVNQTLFCSTLDDGFISNPLSKLKLNVSQHKGSTVNYFNNEGSANGGIEPNAVTTASGSGASIEIIFNPDRCTDGYSGEEFVKTLMHEAIHAKMFNDCWPEGTSASEYRSGFLACLQEHYFLELGSLPEDEQHIAMSHLFVEDIAQAINYYHGGEGDYEDYMYLAWGGLSQYPDYKDETWFIEELAASKIRYESNNLPVPHYCD